MRIRDWSSDVCSSDLGGGAGLVAGFGQAAALGFQRLPGPFQLAHARNGVLELAARLARLLAAGVEGFDQLLDFTVDPGDAVARRFQPALLALQLRSEEHTYELPSLMRTSYAVF